MPVFPRLSRAFRSKDAVPIVIIILAKSKVSTPSCYLLLPFGGCYIDIDLVTGLRKLLLLRSAQIFINHLKKSECKQVSVWEPNE